MDTDREMENVVSALRAAIRDGNVEEAQQNAAKLALKKASIEMALELEDTSKDKRIR